jgi:hypothetical protein
MIEVEHEQLIPAVHFPYRLRAYWGGSLARSLSGLCAEPVINLAPYGQDALLSFERREPGDVASLPESTARETQHMSQSGLMAR